MTIRREQVMAVLGRRSRPLLSPKALLRELGRARRDQRALARVLRELVEAGSLERIGGRYRARRLDGLIEGTIVRRGRTPWLVADDGSAWRITGGEEHEPGQRVLLAPLPPRRPGERCGEVVRATGETRREFVGILTREPTGGLVTPYRDEREWALWVDRRELGEARDGDVVVVGPSKLRHRSGRPTGRVIEVLGPPGTPEADFRALVWRHRLPVAFPAAVEREVERIPATLDAHEVERRIDLRRHEFVTIDPATARDHDDAVCVERLGSRRARLWVAIADVSHYVAEGSALDAEALRRGNSVYFPDRAIPMLPERLSSDLCSLRPGVDRLVMVAEMEVRSDGEIVRSALYPGVIRSRARLAYEEAAEAMEGRGKLPDGLSSRLRELARVARWLQRRRFEAGSIDFDLPEAEIVLGDEGRPVDIVEAPRTIAHRAIEEAMLAANRVVAETLARAEVPALYRVHEPPTPDDVELLRELLESFGLLEGRPGTPLEPREVARAIQRVAGRPEERLVNLVALRCMRQARYEAANRGHFALAFPSYTHFTSPIRRYADLVVHRALKDLLEATPEARARAKRRGERLAAVAARVSFCERLAMEAEREAIALKKCAFMKERVGQEYGGTVTGVARHGFYVTLDEFFVEGLVHISAMEGYWEVDERRHALVARRGGGRVRLGDRVRVRVDSVDPLKGWINFAWLDAEAHGGSGSEAPKRARGPTGGRPPRGGGARRKRGRGRRRGRTRRP